MVSQYVDIVHFSKHQKGWMFRTEPDFYGQDGKLKTYEGTYRINVIVSGDGVVPKTYQINIDYEAIGKVPFHTMLNAERGVPHAFVLDFIILLPACHCCFDRLH